MDRYRQKLSEAYKDATAAYAIDKTIPFAYEMIVKVMAQTGGAENRETILKLIDSAQQKKIYDMHGLHRQYLHFGLSPNWGGTAPMMLDYAQKVARAPDAYPLAPQLLASVHETLAAQLSKSQRKQYYAQPEVWNDIKTSYEAVIKSYNCFK